MRLEYAPLWVTKGVSGAYIFTILIVYVLGNWVFPFMYGYKTLSILMVAALAREPIIADTYGLPLYFV